MVVQDARLSPSSVLSIHLFTFHTLLGSRAAGKRGCFYPGLVFPRILASNLTGNYSNCPTVANNFRISNLPYHVVEARDFGELVG